VEPVNRGGHRSLLVVDRDYDLDVEDRGSSPSREGIFRDELHVSLRFEWFGR
jgi:hypothetical protein